MSDETTADTTEVTSSVDETPEGQVNEDLRSSADDGHSGSSSNMDEPETFPREVVEKLRQENGKYRQRAQQADNLAQRLHTELVRATGRLADPTDLAFDEDHLADADTMAAAIDALLDAKPHLASRRLTGDIGQGNRGPASGSFSLLETLKGLT